MSLAGVFNVPATQPDLWTWSFVHAANHRDINRIIQIETGIIIDEFVLDPFDPNEPGAWLYQHQIMHQQMDAVLGIEGYDLLDIDFNDHSQFAGWVWVNAQEHYQACNILGIA